MRVGRRLADNRGRTCVCDCGDCKLAPGGGAWRGAPPECPACDAHLTVRGAAHLTKDEFDRLRLGVRTHGPALLWEAFERGVIDDATVTASVAVVWCMDDFPDRALDWPSWRKLFNIAGYTVYGEPAARPSEPRRLYRGAPFESRAGPHGRILARAPSCS
jgi:hypothetical protein